MVPKIEKQENGEFEQGLRLSIWREFGKIPSVVSHLKYKKLKWFTRHSKMQGNATWTHIMLNSTLKNCERTQASKELESIVIEAHDKLHPMDKDRPLNLKIEEVTYAMKNEEGCQKMKSLIYNYCDVRTSLGKLVCDEKLPDGTTCCYLAYNEASLAVHKGRYHNLRNENCPKAEIAIPLLCKAHGNLWCPKCKNTCPFCPDNQRFTWDTTDMGLKKARRHYSYTHLTAKSFPNKKPGEVNFNIRQNDKKVSAWTMKRLKAQWDEMSKELLEKNDNRAFGFSFETEDTEKPTPVFKEEEAQN